MAAQRVLVCFDYEGRHGMPFAADYDIHASTRQILDLLDRYRAHAVFFVLGALAIDHPDLVSEIAGRGHEIAVHGWRHDHLDGLSQTALATFSNGLAHAEAAIEDATGAKPTGFRAPYLLAPVFFDPALYQLLAARGYEWTSNREIRHPVELLRPDRIGTNLPWRLTSAHRPGFGGLVGGALRLALNPRLFSRRAGPRGSVASAKWLLDGCPPYHRCGLLEIPLYSPMDCDLLGLPPPSVATPRDLLAYAHFALRSCLSRSGPLALLTFHDWIIGAGNRLSLLDSLLSHISHVGTRAVTVRESGIASREFDRETSSVPRR